jgi:hypothetical protein
MNAASQDRQFLHLRSQFHTDYMLFLHSSSTRYTHRFFSTFLLSLHCSPGWLYIQALKILILSWIPLKSSALVAVNYISRSCIKI